MAHVVVNNEVLRPVADHAMLNGINDDRNGGLRHEPPGGTQL